MKEKERDHVPSKRGDSDLESGTSATKVLFVKRGGLLLNQEEGHLTREVPEEHENEGSCAWHRDILLESRSLSDDSKSALVKRGEERTFPEEGIQIPILRHEEGGEVTSWR